MVFRITSYNMTAQALQAARQHTQRLAKLQEQLTTGLRVNRPSDDPIDTRAILSYRSSDLRLESDRQNIRAARVKLNSSVTSLLEAKDLMVSAKTIALQSPLNFERHVLANQVDQLYQRMLQVANAEIDDEFLFAGTAVRTRPFAEQLKTDGTSVQYFGSEQRVSVVVGVEMVVETQFRGDELFAAENRQATVFSGDTGAAAGSGTDSGVGRRTLQVHHVSTAYAAGSGVLPGTSSNDSDTIIGPSGAHQLEIIDTSGDGSSGTVSLNGGVPVPFTNADSDLRVVGLEGEVVYVDTTAITAGFSGSVDITAAGSLSLDEGATVVPIDFTENQVVQHDPTGQVTHVDSRQIRFAGTETIDHVGTVDVFQALTQFRDDLLEQGDLSDTEWEELVSRSMGEFERYIDHFLSGVGEQSSTLENLDALQVRNEDVQLETRRILTELEGVDVSEAVINMQTEQNLLEYTYASTAQLFQQSLLRYL